MARHLLTLLARDHRVTAFNPRGTARQVRWEAIGRANCDVRDLAQVVAAVRGRDAVIHLAASARPRLIRRRAERYGALEANVLGTYNLVEACAEAGARLVFPSTREVYRQPAPNPIPEDHPLEPLNPYVTSKLAGELYCRTFASALSLRSVVLRFTNVYGPGDRQRLIPVLTERALQGEPLVIFEDQVLDFLYVEDAARALVRAAVDSDVEGETFNVGSGRGHSLTEVAAAIRALVGSSSPIVVSRPDARTVPQVLDVSRARHRLRFEAKYDLGRGLKRTLAASGVPIAHQGTSGGLSVLET